MIIKQDYGTLTGGELEVESIITDVQKSLTAGKNYATGKTFIYDGKMYKATSDIAAGSAIVLSGSGANATLAGAVMDKINNLELSYMRSKLFVSGTDIDVTITCTSNYQPFFVFVAGSSPSIYVITKNSGSGVISTKLAGNTALTVTNVSANVFKITIPQNLQVTVCSALDYSYSIA